MLENKYGRDIDRHDFVVRLKRSKETLKFPEAFGRFCEAVCGSWTIRDMLTEGAPTAREQWAFLDSRHHAVGFKEIDGWYKCAPPGVSRWVRRKICRTWNNRYRTMRTPVKLWRGTERKETSDELGHTHMSAGLHAIIYACHKLHRGSDHTVRLFGFDSVQSGQFTWSVTRGPDWKQYPDHRWDIEKQMIPLIAQDYHVQVVFA